MCFPTMSKGHWGKLSYLPSASWRIRPHSVRWQGSMPRHTLPWGFKTCHAFEGEHHMCVPEWMVKRELPMKVGRRSTIEGSSPFIRNEETSLICMTSAINMIYSVNPKENRQNSLCQRLQKKNKVDVKRTGFNNTKNVWHHPIVEVKRTYIGSMP